MLHLSLFSYLPVQTFHWDCNISSYTSHVSALKLKELLVWHAHFKFSCAVNRRFVNIQPRLVIFKRTNSWEKRNSRNAISFTWYFLKITISFFFFQPAMQRNSSLSITLQWIFRKYNNIRDIWLRGRWWSSSQRYPCKKCWRDGLLGRKLFSKTSKIPNYVTFFKYPAWYNKRKGCQR